MSRKTIPAPAELPIVSNPIMPEITPLMTQALKGDVAWGGTIGGDKRWLSAVCEVPVRYVLDFDTERPPEV